MDASTIKLHHAVLRQMKGVLTAYAEWLADQEAESMATQLKHERERLDKKSKIT